MKKNRILVAIAIILAATGKMNAQFSTPNGTISSTTNPTTTNVGIGTLTPTEKLEVYGNIKVNSSGSFLVNTSYFTSDQGGSIMLKAANSTATPYLNFNNYNDSQSARFIYRNNSLTLEGTKLNMDNQGIEFTHSIFGQGYGAKMYGLDEGNGSTSMRFAVRANNASFTDIMTLKTTGNVGIGTIAPSEKFEVVGNSKISGKVGIGVNTFPANTLYSNYKLFVTGGILTDEVRVVLSASGTWADYVFAKDYNLKSLNEVAEFINENGHLPNVPSAKEVKENGIALGDMSRIQQEKIEELTLYLIQQNKEIETLKAQVQLLMNKK